MRRVIRVACGALAALSMMPALHAQQAIDPFQTPGWSGSAYLDHRGTFSHCAVSSSYSGVALTFTLGPAYDFRIEIGADDWRLKAGGDYVATVVIDSHQPLQVIAAARSTKSIVADFGPDEDIVKELRDGLFLRVLAENIGLSFSLSGSSQALIRLRSCVNDHRSQTPR